MRGDPNGRHWKRATIGGQHKWSGVDFHSFSPTQYHLILFQLIVLQFQLKIKLFTNELQQPKTINLLGEKSTISYTQMYVTLASSASLRRLKLTKPQFRFRDFSSSVRGHITFTLFISPYRPNSSNNCSSSDHY